MPRVSVIATVFNEATCIEALLATLKAQTRAPDDIVIVDAGSYDGTLEVLQRWQERWQALRVVSVPGVGRSEGRNWAIRLAVHEWIAATDAGVDLDVDWLEQLLHPVEEARECLPDVVSGFFHVNARHPFEEVLGAVTLPLEDEIDPDSFLPSSRSVLFTRAAWSAAGGYPEWLDVCEDLVFDMALRAAGARFHCAPRAVVRFRPRPSARQFFRQYYSYARGDGKANLWLLRHLSRYVAYVSLFLSLAGAASSCRIPQRLLWLAPAVAGSATYLRKPYVRLFRTESGIWKQRPVWCKLLTLALVPLLRFTGDIAKMLGYPVGAWWRLRYRRLRPSIEPQHRIWPQTADQRDG
ncbi:MAG: glycosyltransferase [Chloroflexi bacterium]|nr:glycosyltransferase [Chloroflexota bacterium]